MRIYPFCFILLLILSCTDNKRCTKINSTITQKQNEIDLSFAKQIIDKDNEIMLSVIDTPVDTSFVQQPRSPFSQENSYENKDKDSQMQKRRDSLYSAAYQLLKRNKTFQQKGLYGNMSLIGRTILLYNKKYKELDSLLQNNDCFSSFDDKIIKEQVTFLAYKKEDFPRAKKAIQKADKMILKRLPEKLEKDNLTQLALFYYYVGNRAMWQGREVGYQIVDSLVKIHSGLEEYSQNMKEGCDFTDSL